MDEVTAAADASLQQAAIAGSVAQLDIEIFIRGVNAVKAISVLLAEAHWEFAAGPVRQLFELVINAEYLGNLPDRDEAALRYATFGLLQTALQERDQMLYDKSTGRDVDEPRLRVIEAILARSFPMFRNAGSNGKITWARTWCGKSARELAQLSTNRLRPDQYELLFRAWSSQTHGSPGAIVGASRFLDAPAIMADDDRRVVETGTIAVTLFVELWQALPHVPPLAPQAAHAWARRMIVLARDQGAPAPVPTTTPPPDPASR